LCKTEKPSSRFSKTQFGKFCRNPVIFQKPSSENDKTQFFRNFLKVTANFFLIILVFGRVLLFMLLFTPKFAKLPQN